MPPTGVCVSSCTATCELSSASGYMLWLGTASCFSLTEQRKKNIKQQTEGIDYHFSPLFIHLCNYILLVIILFISVLFVNSIY